MTRKISTGLKRKSVCWSWSQPIILISRELVTTIPPPSQALLLFTMSATTVSDTDKSIEALPSVGDWEQDADMMISDDLSATSHEEASKVFELWQTESSPTTSELSPGIVPSFPIMVSPTSCSGRNVIDSDDLDFMDVVDEEADQLCSSFLDDNDNDLLFPIITMTSLLENALPTPNASGTEITTTESVGPLADLVYMTFDDSQDIDQFSLSLLTSDDDDDDSRTSFRSSPSTNTLGSVEAAPKNGLSNLVAFEHQYRATLLKLAASMKRSQETRKSLKIETPETKKYFMSQGNKDKSLTSILDQIERSTIQLLKVHEEASSVSRAKQ
jgi:hypothetical protein